MLNSVVVDKYLMSGAKPLMKNCFFDKLKPPKFPDELNSYKVCL